MKEFDLEQEITWLREEIDQDEFVMRTGDASAFHAGRIRENKKKLQELIDLRQPNA